MLIHFGVRKKNNYGLLGELTSKLKKLVSKFSRWLVVHVKLTCKPIPELSALERHFHKFKILLERDRKIFFPVIPGYSCTSLYFILKVLNSLYTGYSLGVWRKEVGKPSWDWMKELNERILFNILRSSLIILYQRLLCPHRRWSLWAVTHFLCSTQWRGAYTEVFWWHSRSLLLRDFAWPVHGFLPCTVFSAP